MHYAHARHTCLTSVCDGTQPLDTPTSARLWLKRRVLSRHPAFHQAREPKQRLWFAAVERSLGMTTWIDVRATSSSVGGGGALGGDQAPRAGAASSRLSTPVLGNLPTDSNVNFSNSTRRGGASASRSGVDGGRGSGLPCDGGGGWSRGRGGDRGGGAGWQRDGGGRKRSGDHGVTIQAWPAQRRRLSAPGMGAASGSPGAASAVASCGAGLLPSSLSGSECGGAAALRAPAFMNSDYGASIEDTRPMDPQGTLSAATITHARATAEQTLDLPSSAGGQLGVDKDPGILRTIDAAFDHVQTVPPSVDLGEGGSQSGGAGKGETAMI